MQTSTVQYLVESQLWPPCTNMKRAMLLLEIVTLLFVHESVGLHATDLCYNAAILREELYPDQKISFPAELLSQKMKEDLETVLDKISASDVLIEDKINEMENTKINSSMKYLEDLEANPVFRGKLVTIVEGKPKDFIMRCHSIFHTDAGLSTIGGMPNIRNVVDLLDLRDAMEKYSIAYQPIVIEAEREGYVNPTTHLILANYNSSSDYQVAKNALLYYLSFDDRDTPRITATDTAFVKGFCLSHMMAHKAKESHLHIVVSLLKALSQTMNSMGDFVTRWLHVHDSLTSIPTPDASMIRLTLETPFPIYDLMQKMARTEDEMFWKLLSSDEIAFLEELHQRIMYLLDKYDLPEDEIPIQVPKNTTQFLSQTVGTQLQSQAIFKMRAKDAIADHIYGEAFFTPISSSGFPIKVYKILPLIEGIQKITHKALVRMNTNAFTLSEVPSRIGEIWEKEQNNECAAFILQGRQENPCPTQEVISPYVTPEFCNSFPPTLILSTPYSLKVTLSCPKNMSSSTQVAPGNTRFPKTGSCIMADDITKEILYQPSFKSKNAQIPLPVAGHSETTEGFFSDIKIVLENDTLAMFFFFSVAFAGIGLFMMMSCACFFLCRVNFKKRVERVRHCKHIRSCVCMDPEQEPEDDEEMSSLNTNLDKHRKGRRANEGPYRHDSTGSYTNRTRRQFYDC